MADTPPPRPRPHQGPDHEHSPLSAAGKARLVLAGLRDPAQSEILCAEQQISTAELDRWTEDFLAGGTQRLADPQAVSISEQLRSLHGELAALKERLDRLDGSPEAQATNESADVEITARAEVIDMSSRLEQVVKQQVAMLEEERSRSEPDQQEQHLRRLGLSEQDWVHIPAGSYLMGSPESEKDRFDNERQHEVELAAFEMLRTPVTFDMYDRFCQALRLPMSPDEGWGRGGLPVINVTYWGAVEYCIWLSAETGWRVRLPTEAEWEYACRAGTQTPFWTGETITTYQANFDGNYTYQGGPKGISRSRTTPVDEFPPNPWGLHDMHGNVWEWCASAFEEEYAGEEYADTSQDREDHRERVLRGGSWYNVPSGIRSAARNRLRPNYHYLRVGFRIVRDTGN